MGPRGEVALVRTDDALHLVDADDGRTRWTADGRFDRVVFSPDGKRLAVCDVEADAALLRVADGEPALGLGMPARDVAFGPSGTLAVVERRGLERDGVLHLVDAGGLYAGDSVAFPHTRVVWSPRGDVLLGWGPGPQLALYRRDGRQLTLERPRIRPRLTLSSVAFHPSGRWFAASTVAGRTGHVPAEVLVWEVGENEVPLFSAFPLHEGTAAVVRFGPDADDPRVLSAGVDGAFVWPLDPLPAARARAPRDLDGDEWTRERLLATGEEE